MRTPTGSGKAAGDRDSSRRGRAKDIRGTTVALEAARDGADRTAGLPPENLVYGFVLRWLCHRASLPAAHLGSRPGRAARRCITEYPPSHDDRAHGIAK